MSIIEVDDHDVEITHGDRVVFPDAGITKSEVVDYYVRVAEWMTPHLRGRPLVMHRFPDGLGVDPFFQKQAPSHFPDWIRTAELTRRGGGSVEHVVVCDGAATLVYVVNQGAFELHTLLAAADRPDRPDQLILDLDPSTDDIEPVVLAVRATRDVLDDLELTGFAKSTGSRGVHVHVLLDGSVGIDEVREVAKHLATRVVERDPDTFTIAQSKKKRGDRVFVDWLRNGYGQHAVAPYSVRARPGAPVALPMDWDEVTSAAFDPRAHTVRNAFRRLAQKQDPWEHMARHRYDAAALRDRLDRS